MTPISPAVPNLPKLPPTVGELDADQACATVLASIVDPSGTCSLERAYQVMTERNAALAAGGKDEIRRTLGRQVVIMEALTARFALLASKTNNTSAATSYGKAATSAHRALIATLSALYAMEST